MYNCKLLKFTKRFVWFTIVYCIDNHCLIVDLCTFWARYYLVIF